MSALRRHPEWAFEAMQAADVAARAFQDHPVVKIAAGVRSPRCVHHIRVKGWDMWRELEHAWFTAGFASAGGPIRWNGVYIHPPAWSEGYA